MLQKVIEGSLSVEREVPLELCNHFRVHDKDGRDDGIALSIPVVPTLGGLYLSPVVPSFMGLYYSPLVPSHGGLYLLAIVPSSRGFCQTPPRAFLRRVLSFNIAPSFHGSQLCLPSAVIISPFVPSVVCIYSPSFLPCAYQDHPRKWLGHLLNATGPCGAGGETCQSQPFVSKLHLPGNHGCLFAFSWILSTTSRLPRH